MNTTFCLLTHTHTCDWTPHIVNVCAEHIASTNATIECVCWLVKLDVSNCCTCSCDAPCCYIIIVGCVVIFVISISSARIFLLSLFPIIITGAFTFVHMLTVCFCSTFCVLHFYTGPIKAIFQLIKFYYIFKYVVCLKMMNT